jgi:hypothetical protein
MDGQGRTLYVACQGTPGVLAWDLRHNRKLAERRVADGPLRLQLEPERALLRVLCRRARRVYLLQTPGLQLLRILALPDAPAAWLEDPERKWSIACCPDSNLVRMYQGLNPLPTIEAGKTPADLWLQPGTDKLWVANYKGQELAVIGLDRNQVVRRVPVHPNPKKFIYSTQERKLYVLCTGKDAFPAKSVIQTVDLIYQTAGLTRSVGTGARDFALAPDGQTWYVATKTGLLVLAADGSETSLKTGRDPQAVIVAPDGSRVFVSCREDQAVYVYPLEKAKP